MALPSAADTLRCRFVRAPPLCRQVLVLTRASWAHLSESTNLINITVIEESVFECVFRRWQRAGPAGTASQVRLLRQKSALELQITSAESDLLPLAHLPATVACSRWNGMLLKAEASTDPDAGDVTQGYRETMQLVQSERARRNLVRPLAGSIE